MRLTQRGNKVFVGTQGLRAALVLVVPDPKGFVVSTAHYEPSSRMKQHPAHPVVMSHLQRQEFNDHPAPLPSSITQKSSVRRLTRVMRQMPMLTSHILIVLSLDPERRKGPGFPLFLLCKTECKKRCK